MPRKKRASVIGTLLSVKGVSKLLRNFTAPVQSGPDSAAEHSSTSRHSRRTSDPSGSTRRHRRSGTRPKSYHPGAWPKSPELRAPKDTSQDDESEPVRESDSRYDLFQDSRNDFSHPSIRRRSSRHNQRGTRSVASSSRGTSKLKSPCIDRGSRRKTMGEDTDLNSSGSEKSIPYEMKSRSYSDNDDSFDDDPSSAHATEISHIKRGSHKANADISDDDDYRTKRGYGDASYARQFTKRVPRRQVRFVKSNAHLRGLFLDTKLSLTPSKYEKFEAHYQKTLAQKQHHGSTNSEQPMIPSPKVSQFDAPRSLTAPSLPASPVSTRSRALSTTSVLKTKTVPEFSLPTESSYISYTNVPSTAAATISSARASTASSPTISRAPSRATSRAPPSRTASKDSSRTTFREPSRSDARTSSRATFVISKPQQKDSDPFIATSATSSAKPTLSSQKTASNISYPVPSPRLEFEQLYKQPGNNVHEQRDKQHDEHVNEEAGKQVDENPNAQFDKRANHSVVNQTKYQGSKQPGYETKDSVSSSKETAHRDHITNPDVTINCDSDADSNPCPLDGLLPEVYDCKHGTRHCYACSRPRDMRYVEFRTKYCRGEQPLRSLCRSCRRHLNRNIELDPKPINSNKRMLKDINKFHWCAQCGTVRSQKFHEYYPSGTEVPPRHQLCHPCCNFAKLPSKTNSSTYQSYMVDDDTSNNTKQSAGGNDNGHAETLLDQRKDLRSVDDCPQNRPTMTEPLPSFILAEETSSTKHSAPVVSPTLSQQHHPSEYQTKAKASASQTAAATSSQSQDQRWVADSSPEGHDSPNGFNNLDSQTWQIPADDSPPPQRKRPTTRRSHYQDNEAPLYEDIHVNYHEFHGQEDVWKHQPKHHRDYDDVNVPEILLTAPTEEIYITQPTVVFDEQYSGAPLHEKPHRRSRKAGPVRDSSGYQREPSMQSQSSNRTVRQSDYDFSSGRNKENFPAYPPQHTTSSHFHWPTEKEKVDENQPKGLSDMFFETEEGKYADAYFASMRSWSSEPKAQSRPRADSTDNYNTWPSGSYDATEPEVYEYLGKRRSERPSVIPEVSPNGHARKASDTFSVETIGVWQGATEGAPRAEVTEPESPYQGHQVSTVACRVQPSREKGGKKDSCSATTTV
ncbi:hypothetical protein B0T20DRAFT_358556 [Sordaria brevicollis]|uniref:Uncharacterized protein n=1 Tax=Sordaria brevicollis TaxID=83679 RepID=A0AAE0PBF3_SORBR|nr:hypothetical protein B0T20DRAFT_358556 [Sordaria brevicollis]